MLPFTSSHISKTFVENVTCFAGSMFRHTELYPSWQKRLFFTWFYVFINTGPSLAFEMIWFFSFSFSFPVVRQGVLHAFATWDMSFSILLGKVRRQTWQEPCSPGSLQAEDAPHLQGQGTSGSRRQHHLGCVREQKQLWSGSGFSDGLLKAAHKCMGFQTFPLERVSAAAKGVAAACAGLPTLN